MGLNVQKPNGHFRLFCNISVDCQEISLSLERDGLGRVLWLL